jgi:DNA-3-methyladenine glycosylase II
MQMDSFRIPVQQELDFGECRWFLDRNFDECLHVINGDAVLKALTVKGQHILFSIEGSGDSLYVKILQGKLNNEIEQEITSYISEWFDLKRNLTEFYALLLEHEQLAYMVKEYRGLRLIGIPDLFEAISWAIIGQQINLNFAYKVKRRLVEKYGDRIEYGDNVYFTFPTFNKLATEASAEDLRSMQFSNSKAIYLLTVASAFSNGEISKSVLIDLPDQISRQKALTSLKGIGIWTANYALMKSLREPGSIPYGDAGLLNALLAHGLIRDKKDHLSIDRLFNRFSGWETYLVFYLWRSLAVRK